MATEPDPPQPQEAPTAIAPTEDARTRIDPGDSGAGPVRLALALDEAAPRYDVLRELGRGGMGEVELCFDRRIGRQVALKRSTMDAAAAPESDRFLREICVQGQLEHPTVVPLHDLSVGADGRVYFTMKHVRGRTLKNILSALRQGDAKTREQFPLRKLLAALANVCLGVAFAHSRGVIHRDLKPDNLMLGAFGEVYVLDWGVAKVVSVQEPVDDVVRVPGHGGRGGETEAGSLVGTPGYMSPEQCTADLHAVGDRADIYSLGAILFELLAQTPLHAGSTLEKIHSTLDGADARVHVRAPDREPMPELEAICVQATARSPDDRPATAREMSERIEAYLNHDRDVELRRGLAATHARAASAAAERVLGRGSGSGDAPEGRRRGLAEAGRALALDPGNEEAMRVMLRLLTAPPREAPLEVLREEETALYARRKEMMRFSALGCLVFTCVSSLSPSIGIVSWAAFALYATPGLLCTAATFALSRVEKLGDGHLVVSIAANAFGLLGLVMALGPLLVAPGFAAIFTLGHLLYMDRYRAIAAMVGCGSVLVPLGLQWSGVMPPSYAFGNQLVVLPRIFFFHAAPTIAILTATAIVLIGFAAALGAKIRGAVRDAERRLNVQAWQLRHLVPSAPVAELPRSGLVQSRPT